MTADIEGVTLHLAHPDVLSVRWVGQEELMRQLLAAWLVVSEEDLPMNPRLLGKPGVGKTTLAYAAARRMGRDVYILQGTLDTRPEDLLVTPVIEGAGKLRYVASPLVTAMILGGIAILDEGNRMSEKSWASLAPLLDSRRYVESIVAGIKIKAHPNFRMVTTMNDDASTFDLPEYIHSRLQPQIFIDFPERLLAPGFQSPDPMAQRQGIMLAQTLHIANFQAGPRSRFQHRRNWRQIGIGKNVAINEALVLVVPRNGSPADAMIQKQATRF